MHRTIVDLAGILEEEVLELTSRSFDEGTWIHPLCALLNPQAELSLH